MAKLIAERPIKVLQLLGEAEPGAEHSTAFTFNWKHVNRNYIN